MKIARRTFTKSLGVAAAMLALPSWATKANAARLPVNRVTRIRTFYPPNYNANGPQAFPQSNMIVLVDTEAGLTGIGQGGSPDTVRNMARSVIGKNAFETEFIWQHGFMDGFYSPGKERLHALGAIDLALWDIKGKALKAPLYELFGGKARQHIELYATNGVPPGLIPQNQLQGMSLKERAAATMAAGYRVYRVDSAITPTVPGAGPRGGGGAGARGAAAAGPVGVTGSRGTFNSRSRIRLIGEAAAQIRDGIGPDGDWMIDLHQSFDFHEAVEVCNLIAPTRPFCVEDPLREEQFRTQIPKLRLMTSVPLAPGEEWGTRAEFSPLVEQRDIDFARASLPNVGGITEMLKIMALCDLHKVGIVPHFTGPIATAGHMQTMMAFPGQVLMEFNLHDRPVPYLPEFLDFRNGKVWPNDRPGLGVTIDEKLLTPIETLTQGASGPTYLRPDGSPTHW
ncbi:MAG TPA: mandelate racemase/muconate lactonizing enzyme family protein [Terriglobia bacterium]|nr:mandelate racemase/muconate lactonizing enzyme family protein [Terriglobia bacterium]